MAIAEQFAGLQMDQLIGAPLRAAADASTQLANSTADFINRVGFDTDGKVRTVTFAYQRNSVNEDGTSNLDEMKVDVPMLAIVPIPNLQVDEVNILFDMEVKQSEKQESSMDMGATLSGSVNLGIVKVSVTGSISAHQSNTRSSDNSAKYHVDVRATNHGIPEGLARVLDMMAANISPALMGSTLKDGNGQNLPEQARLKAERLKALRQEISQIEARLIAAKDGLNTQIARLKKFADDQMLAYQASMMSKINTLDKNNDAALRYSQAMDTVNTSWNNFTSQISDCIRTLVACNIQVNGTEVAESFALMEVADDGTTVTYKTGSYYTSIAGAQKTAVEAMINVDAIEDELFQKKAEYSDVMAGKVAVSATSSTSGARGSGNGDDGVDVVDGEGSM